MNYHNITYPDQNNGDGLRITLWCSGCSHRCYNCQNSQTWDINSGIQFDEFAETEMFEELSKDYISGITFSGGDPLHENNINEILSLTKKIRRLFPSKTIWLYTGYTWEQIMYPVVTGDVNFERDKMIETRKNIINNVDVLIDGKYIDKLRDITLHWCGSSNQRVIDVQKTLSQNKIILYEDT